MPTVELDIRQLAEEGGTNPIAPTTVTDAVLDEDGNTLTDILDEINAGLIELNVDSVTVTTSGSGSANLSIPSGRLVVAAAPTTGDYVVIPVISQDGSTWVKVFNWSMSPVGTTVTIRYYYIKTSLV